MKVIHGARRRFEAQVFGEQSNVGSIRTLSVINNAGISYRAVIEHMTEEDELLQFRTNFFGPMALIRLVLPYMRRQRWGRIINVSSIRPLAMPL